MLARALITSLLALPLLGAAEPVSLFNGKDLSGWKLRGANQDKTWKVVSSARLDPNDSKNLAGEGAEGVLLRLPLPRGEEGADLVSEKTFGDCTVSLEFMVPKDGNSGLFLQGQYEVQITDSAGLADDKIGPGDCAGVPWVSKPSTNAFTRLGEWQTLEVVFRAPRFDAAGKKTENARFVSITLNGKKVQENVELKEPTGLELEGGERARGPIMIQGLEGQAAFRNIKVVEQ